MPKKTYSLTDIEAALHACNNAVIQARRGHGEPILTLGELKEDAEALTGLVVRAKAEPANSLTFHDIGFLMPRLAHWHQRGSRMPPSRPAGLEAH